MSRPFERGPFEALPEAPRRAHPFFELAVREVQVDTSGFGPVRIAYREAGEGPPLLLVHGLMTTGYSFRYVVEALARDFRVLVPDLPGAGRSDKPRGPYAPEALAASIGELQSALGVRGCAVVGNSLGGYLAMRLALDDPEAMARLVTIHAPAFADARMIALHAALAVPGVRGLLARVVRRDPLRWAHENVHYWDETLKSLEEAHEYGDPLAADGGAEGFIGWLGDALAPSGFRAFGRTLAARRDRGEAFPVPLALVYAEQDPMVPPRTGARLSTLVPGAAMHWLSDASHFAQVDAPDRLVAILQAFLAPVLEGVASR